MEKISHPTNLLQESCFIDMRRILTVVFVVLLGADVLGAQQLDSLTKAELGGRIEEYFGALAGESPGMQMEEADFMIALSPDSLIRQFTAVKIYEHYAASPVMGAENVAIHIYDRWFKGGEIRMTDDMDLLNARIFADFNRQSLIGEKAPELVMESKDGPVVSLFTPEDAGGKYRVLFFYDAGCAKCKVESILLRNMLMTEDYPIEFYAIYAGDSRKAWDSYVEEKFAFDNASIKIVHLWDPMLDSDFQRKYGVIQTPRLFLVDPEGTIIGRGLDAKALALMLHNIFDGDKLTYGGEESVALFDGIFAGKTVADDVRRIADYMEETTLGRGDEKMFRQLVGDMLYWLSNRSGEAFKEGADYLIDNKILSRPEIWKSADDSLKVIGLAQFMDGLLDKAGPGTAIADLEVPGERVRSSKSKFGEFRLGKLRGKRNVVIFYTEGCGNCRAEKEAARELALRDRKVCILMVNVDEIVSSYPELAGRLFESFDLSTLPFIVETDKTGKITRRYGTLL